MRVNEGWEITPLFDNKIRLKKVLSNCIFFQLFRSHSQEKKNIMLEIATFIKFAVCPVRMSKIIHQNEKLQNQLSWRLERAKKKREIEEKERVT